MNAAQFVAGVLCSGEIFGLKVGDHIASVAAAMGDKYIDDLSGKWGHKTLRRDYGLLEVTFNEPDWSCTWITLELHRTASRPELIEETSERFGVAFSQYLPWAEVRHELQDAGTLDELIEVEPQDGYKSFALGGGKTILRVVSDPGAERGALPGDNDIWALETRQLGYRGRTA